MMKLKIVAVALLLFCAFAAFSQYERDTQYLSGSELLSYCESSAVSSTGTWCLGYVLGVWHTTASRREVCPPPRLTSGELRRVVVRYLHDRPETLNRQPADLVVEALHKTFPCA